MRGRKPKPTQLHALHGTTNATRHAPRKREPVAEGELLIEPPDWLSDSQKAGWVYAMKNAPKGVLRRIDRGILAVWVEAEDRHRTAVMMQAKLDRGSALPLLTKGKGKEPTIGISPYVLIATRAAAVLIKAASELGFSPASRPRLVGPGGADSAEDDLEDDGSPFAKMRRLQLLQGGRE